MLTREKVQYILETTNEGSACEQLAEQWLLDHPEDNDELITEEWSKEEMKADDEYVIEINGQWELFLAFGNGDFCVQLSSSLETLVMSHIKTRGQLRSLIKLLKGE